MLDDVRAGGSYAPQFVTRDTGIRQAQRIQLVALLAAIEHDLKVTGIFVSRGERFERAPVVGFQLALQEHGILWCCQDQLRTPAAP